ncbi:MAG: three-Cys-motif partner protein TcmP [Dehalococcoidia bacterium]
MAEPIVWPLEDHTAAKHGLLEAYLKAWLPIMGQQALDVSRRGLDSGKPRLLLVDGFAGPGVYEDGQAGSPILMLRTLLGHSAFGRLDRVKFMFLFIEHDKRRVARLEAEVDALGPLPKNVTVMIEAGHYEDVFGQLITDIQGRGKVIVPTFAFVDPFGYSHSSMSLAGSLLDFPRTEVLIFLPLSAISRFVGRDGQDAAMDSLFGCSDWRDAIELRGEERNEFLMDLFRAQLAKAAGVKHVRSFQLRTRDGKDYRLVFGLAHDRGLEIAKDAMWAVDTLAGTSYVARMDTGEPVLFNEAPPVHLLLAALKQTFGTEPFTIEDAQRRTLDTVFRAAHLKKMTLAPAERSGELEVTGARARRFTYPAGTEMRFTA